MKENQIIVSLTGGLGNQLFQLAAALNIFGDRKIVLTSNYGNPRPFNQWYADLYSFALPKNVVIAKKKRASFLSKKCLGYNLRMGVSPRKYEEAAAVKWLIDIASKFLIGVDLGKSVDLIAGKGVGYCEINAGNKSSILIGYFQSYKWVADPRVKKELMNISPIMYSDELKILVNESLAEMPLFVHVRLTDYKVEEKFGVPSKEYYEKAIKSFMDSGSFSRIWLFSDDSVLALTYIPDEYHEIVKIVPEVGGSPTQTLELLRYGSGYVIANSSFSWWGAKLAYKDNVRVVAPSPWFKGLHDPIDLIPPNWETMKPW